MEMNSKKSAFGLATVVVIATRDGRLSAERNRLDELEVRSALMAAAAGVPLTR